LMPNVIPFLANEVNRYLVHSHFVGRSTPLVTLKTNSDSFLWTTLNSLKSYSGGSHTAISHAQGVRNVEDEGNLLIQSSISIQRTLKTDCLTTTE
jgi:hypothetical protein